MKNKKQRILLYTGAALLPVIIFLICATINGFLPFGKEMLNSYDSFTQYPGMLLEYTRLIKAGNLFYSWNAGLGFNFFGTLTYYGTSPLNLFAIFATPQNYPFFIAIMTYVRFALLGLSMCFYLEHKNIKPKYVLLFSTIFALMGYTSTYYYNYIWIDSVIMLPLVIHGLDKILDGKNPTFYIITLALTIWINYYIGYMICIFSLIWFLYHIFFKENKKELTKTFITSSLLSGLMCAVIIIPTFFALMTGKAELYQTAEYVGLSRNAASFFYSLLPGSYQAGDQGVGPALIYSTVLVAVLAIFYFFNKKPTKKEKIATALVLLFFYLSFSVNALNFAWQFFQRPIWWPSRFSFVFSFFLITLAVKTLTNIDKTEFKRIYRILICIFLIGVTLVSAWIKWKRNTNPVEGFTYTFLGVGILLLIEMMFLLDKKEFTTLLICFTVLDLSLNCFNSLKGNFRYMSYTNSNYIKEEIPLILEQLDKENDNFYRFEFIDDFSSNDGLYFGYHGINYFNSVRNIKVVDLMEKLGEKVSDRCHIQFDSFDPFMMSLFNIKYLYGEKMDYFDNIQNRLYENQHPLALGFTTRNISDVELSSDHPIDNRSKLLKSMTGLDGEVYKKIPIEKFEHNKNNDTFSYSFKSDRHYLVMNENIVGSIIVDGLEKSFREYYYEINKGDELTIRYAPSENYNKDDIFVTLFDIDAYLEQVKILEENLLKANTNTNGHILEGTIDVTGENKYLFTSIEYEHGMTVYVDGKKVNPDIVLDTLIGIPLGDGHHTITIDYVPRGFKPGLIVSIISLASTIGYLSFRSKKKQEVKSK